MLLDAQRMGCILKELHNMEEQKQCLDCLTTLARVVTRTGVQESCLLQEQLKTYGLYESSWQLEAVKDLQVSHLSSLIEGLETGLQELLVEGCEEIYKVEVPPEQVKNVLNKVEILFIPLPNLLNALSKFITRYLTMTIFFDQDESLFEILFRDDKLGIWPINNRNQIKDWRKSWMGVTLYVKHAYTLYHKLSEALRMQKVQ